MNSQVNAPVTTDSAAVAYAAALDVITAAEPDVAAAIAGELASQRRQLKLIASENYASPAVLSIALLLPFSLRGSHLSVAWALGGDAHAHVRALVFEE